MLLFPRDTSAPTIASAYKLRPLTSRRTARLRAMWFVLGSIFGAVAAVSANKFLSASDAPATAAVASAPLTQASTPASPANAPAPTLSAAPVPTAQATPASPAAAPAPVAPTPVVPVSAPHAQEPTLNLPATLSLKMQKKDSLLAILLEKGVPPEEAENALASMKKLYNPKHLYHGQELTLKLERNPHAADKASLSTLTLEASPVKSVSLTRQRNGSFVAKEMKAPISKTLAHAGGTIRSSLYQTAIDSGIPVKMVGEIIQAFSYDVDFQRDIHPGDKLDVVFERMRTDKNITTGIGQMQYASLTLGDETFTVYRHTSADGYTGFYNAKGESVRKALLRTPINGARVTSGFGMRMHPLLGYSKMHKGVDFGAPTGTPIYAAGDGVIEEAGRHAGYGNYVRLRHTSAYATAYGHASRIAKGIHPGAHVRQGQIIAYVGSTGISTGPHLHYEILLNGAQVNPSGVKFRTGQTLAGREFAAFKKQVKQIEAALTTAPRKVQVASLSH